MKYKHTANFAVNLKQTKISNLFVQNQQSIKKCNSYPLKLILYNF